MEGIVLLLVLWIIVMPIMALVFASEAKRRAAAAEREIFTLAGQLERLKRELREQAPGREGAGWTIPPEPVMVARSETASVQAGDPVQTQELGEVPVVPPVVETFGEETRSEPEPVAVNVAPPPLPPRGGGDAAWLPGVERVRQPVPEVPAKPPIDLEQFMGVKLFAWLGGLALFFGVVFFVKYAFENNLIPPAMRVAMGFVTGSGLLVGGLALHRRGTHQALSQALCATAVLVLYGVTFAAYERYGFFNQAGAFALMVLVTVAAFLIAVRLNALVVAGLGMAGGFLTPVLVSTGRDELLILSAYIALLVAGLIAVSRHRNWRFLVTAAVIGTVLIQTGWLVGHFWKDGYANGVKVLWPMAILLGFQGLFTLAAWLERRRGGDSPHPEWAALAMAGTGWAFGFILLGCGEVARHIGWTLGFGLAQSAAVMALVALRPRLMPAQAVGAVVCFLHLAVWTLAFLNEDNLMAALVFYLTFGAAHAVVPMLLARRAEEHVRSALSVSLWPWAGVIPILLGVIFILRLPEPPLVLWGVVLLLNLLVTVLVPRGGSVLPAAAGLLATALLMVVWLFAVPQQGGMLGPVLGISLGFTALFGMAGRWLGRRMTAGGEQSGDRLVLERQVAAAMPVMAGMIPFGLLVLVVSRLPVPEPSAVFGVGVLMVVLLLGLAVLDRRSALVPAAFGGMIAVQAVWHGECFSPEAAAIELGWLVGCYFLFLAFPFVFRKAMEGRTLPWITSALSGVGYFLLVHHGVKHAYPEMAGMLGLLPCAFAIPSLVSLVMVARMAGEMDAGKRSRLAWFGGVALLFITLVFPIQFDRQWLTVSWAVEGALLFWLYRRVPHVGLQLTGLGLLVTVFARLMLNPLVFMDHARAATPVFNTYLYTYGVSAVATFAGAWWMAAPHAWIGRCRPRAVLNALGGILLFALLNIQIANYFTPESRELIQFGGGANFARDMTYSIAWGLFALGLLIMGIWRGVRPARYAAIALLGGTLLKVFLHDLSSLASVFRIGALVGVAVIAFVASFLYQQFFNRSKQP